MLKFVVVAAVVAFAVGIVVGLNATSDGALSSRQILSSALPENTDVPRPDNTSPDRMTEFERIDAEITVLKLLEDRIAQQNGEYEALILEIARLETTKTTLEGELADAVFVSGAASGQ